MIAPGTGKRKREGSVKRKKWCSGKEGNREEIESKIVSLREERMELTEKKVKQNACFQQLSSLF